MTQASTNDIKRRLRAIARRERQVVVMAGTAKIVITVAVFSAVFFLVDWLFMLPGVARLLLVAGGMGVVGWIAKTDLSDPLRRRRDEIAMALKIEKRFPALRDRLISVVQLADGVEGISPDLLAKLELDTAQMTAPLDFADVIDWRFLRKILLMAGAMLVAGVLSGVVFPEYVVTTYRRMLFGNVRYPSLTTIEVRQAKASLVRGEDWNLEIGLGGRIPSSATLKFRTQLPAGGHSKWVAVPLKPMVGYTYGATLEKVQQAFEYQIFAGDAWTELQQVKVLVPVAVLDPLMDVEPPAFTGLPARTNEPLAGASVLEGSRVTFTVPVTKPLTSGALEMAGGGVLELKPVKDGNGATGVFTVEMERPSAAPTSGVLVARNGAASFTVRVRDTEGLENGEPRVLYNLRVLKDRVPNVRLVSPKDDRISVPYAEWKVTYAIDDDFGIRKAWLVWEVYPAGSGAANAGTTPPLRQGRIPLAGAPEALHWEGQAVLDMMAAHASPGETLSVWIEAVDARAGVASATNPVPEWIGRSQAIAFLIVDETAKWEELQKRLGAIEADVVNLYDRQDGVRKTVKEWQK